MQVVYWCIICTRFVVQHSFHLLLNNLLLNSVWIERKFSFTIIMKTELALFENLHFIDVALHRFLTLCPLKNWTDPTVDISELCNLTPRWPLHAMESTARCSLSQPGASEDNSVEFHRGIYMNLQVKLFYFLMYRVLSLNQAFSSLDR